MLTHTYLESFKRIFNDDLKPKQHLLLHYVRAIREMGPVVHFGVMRMEAKHQFFKQVAQKTKNYINLKKTMAQQHQEQICVQNSPFMDQINGSKRKTPLGCLNDFHKYQTAIRNVLTAEMIAEASIVNSVEINGTKYKNGFVFTYEKTLHLIDNVIKSNDKFWLLCTNSFDIEEYDTFLNSFLLKKKTKDSQ